MFKFFEKIRLLSGKIRFYLRMKLLKLLSRGAVNTTGRGFLAVNVEIRLHPTGWLEIGYCELSSGCKLSIETNSSLRIGDGVFFNRGCCVVTKASVSIGSNTLFGENVKIFDHDHIHIPRIEKLKFNSKPISIGSGCWFGSNVVILKGVSVGDNVTIGANTVVSKDIPSNSVLTTNFLLRTRHK